MKQCVIKTQSQEVFKKYKGIFAISVNGVVGLDLYEKSGINAYRMVEFLEENITNNFKNKLIILDNASSHRNPKVKEIINKDNHLLYAVPLIFLPLNSNYYRQNIIKQIDVIYNFHKKVKYFSSFNFQK